MQVQVEKRICGNIIIPTYLVLQYDWILEPATQLLNWRFCTADKISVIAYFKYQIGLVYILADLNIDILNIIVSYLSINIHDNYKNKYIEF
jgi:hypothetical protein